MCTAICKLCDFILGSISLVVVEISIGGPFLKCGQVPVSNIALLKVPWTHFSETGPRNEPYGEIGFLFFVGREETRAPFHKHFCVATMFCTKQGK
jgi:hypothetical protein